MFWTLALSAAITLLALSPVVLPEGSRLEQLPAPLAGIETVGRIVTSEVAAPVIRRIARNDDERTAEGEQAPAESAQDSSGGEVAGALAQGSSPEPTRLSDVTPKPRRDPGPKGVAPPPPADGDKGKPEKEKPGKGGGDDDDDGPKAHKWKSGNDDDDDDDDDDDRDHGKSKAKKSGDHSKDGESQTGGDHSRDGKSKKGDDHSKDGKSKKGDDQSKGGKGKGDHSKSTGGSRD